MAGKTRAPHKEGCMCIICKAKRAKLEAPVEPEVTAPPPPPSEVQLGTLPLKARFMLRGQEHVVAEKLPRMVVCYNLPIMAIVTLGSFIMVKPIK